MSGRRDATGRFSDRRSPRMVVLSAGDPRTGGLASWILGQQRPGRGGAGLDTIRQLALPHDELLLVLGERDAGTEGAVLAHVPADGLAEVIGPRLLPGIDAGLGERLLERIVAELPGRWVRLMVAYLCPEDGETQAWFAAQRFRATRDLLVMSGEAWAASRPEPPVGWRLRPYSPIWQQTLVRVLVRTSLGAEDYPELDIWGDVGKRLTQLEQARGSGARLWSLVEWEGRVVGGLLLTDRAEAGHCELTYLGLIPPARGRGCGLWLVRHALWQTRSWGRSRLVAGVDTANGPALATYARAGFVEIDRRRVVYRVPGASERRQGPLAD